MIKYALTLTILMSLCICVTAQIIIPNVPKNPDYYVFNGSADTLFLTKMDVGKAIERRSTKILDTIQIDGRGLKEVIFERLYEGSTEDISEVAQREEHTKITKYEVWNIDTKTLLFEAVSYFENRFVNWKMMGNASSNNDGWSRGHCFYSYDFYIDSVGKINISNLKTFKTKYHCSPNKKEGLYVFKNGHYFKE